MEIVKSYAKVNLGLSVIRKTRKNYHKLKMVMSQIELCDDLIFEPSDEIKVITSFKVCDMKENLCYKVAEYLKEKYGGNQGIKITIIKNIPDGGGLGGGSSNAATVLKFLNKYWGLNLSDKKLKKIGFKFGCDIPFFVDGNISYVYGYGEKIKPIKSRVKNDKVVLIIPEFKNSTKIIFDNHEIAHKNKSKIQRLIRSLKEGDYKAQIFNDLECTANKISGGVVYDIKNKLLKIGLKNTVMSGSGSTIVSYLADDYDVASVVEKIKDVLPNVRVIVSELKLQSK